MAVCGGNRIVLLSALAALALAPVTASASGGGGGGGGGMPSVEAPQYNPAEEYRKGVDALKAGQFREADRYFDHVLEAAPRNVDVLYVSGLAKEGRGDFKGAVRTFEKALKIEPGRIPVRRELALSLAKLGETDKAQAELDTLKKSAAACGDTCAEAADLKSAIVTVQAALAPAAPASPAAPGTAAPGAAPGAVSLLLSDPASGDHSYVQAVRLINEGRYQDALVALGRAREVFGPHPDVLTYTGYTYRKLHQYDRAESYYRQALAIAPNHRGATEYYGEMMAERGDLVGARHMLVKLEALCNFACPEADDLRRWIDKSPAPQS
jgi:tetratricopeptide (TPR) repeat protein